MFFKDWKDEACYADTETHDLIAWAWEFIRRNKEYQSCCSSQFSFPSHKERFSYVVKKFGFAAIIDPSYDGADYFREGLEPVFSPSSLDLGRIGSKEKITVVFDLTKDIGVQLAMAETRLISEQEKLGLVLPNAKQRGREWKQYIRLLDAHHSGTKRREAASFFYHRHSDPPATYSDALQQAKLLSKNGYKKLLRAAGFKLMG